MGAFRGIFLYCAVIIFSCGALGAAGDRITAPIQAGRTAALKGHHHPEAIPANDLGPADPAMSIEYATLHLRPAPGIEAFLAAQQNPSSPEYRHWLTPEQFADRFGLSGNDIGRIQSWLRSNGLDVQDVARGRLWITFSGSAARVGQAFRTQLRRYRVNGVNHFANATDPEVPAALEPVIEGIDGLTDFALLHMHTPLRPLAEPRFNAPSGDHFLVPDDLATIYGIAPLYAKGIDGTGQKVVVVGRTDVDLADIRQFRTRFNLPPNDPKIVLYGPDPGTNQEDLGEADLDLEWAGAVARNATIVYVNSRSVNTSAQYAVDQNLAPVMTMSYGACELFVPQSLRGVAQQANAQGITWMVSSGDVAAATCDRSAPVPEASRGATVAYPSSIPEVTSVGGTEFDEGDGDYWDTVNNANRASAKSYIPERIWNDSGLRNDLIGGGGGPSAFFPKPLWQTGPGVPNDNARDLPDISFTASADHDGYEVVNRGGVFIVGGTSASSPVFAGMIALLNQAVGANGLGNINPTLYRLARSGADAFHDIVNGDNKVPCAQGSPKCLNGMVGFPATSGYDLASGLGSLDISLLVAGWNNGSASTTALSVSPAEFSPDDTVQLTATVAGTDAAPTGSVTFVAGDVALGSVVLTPGAKTSTATFQADGILVAAGNGTAGALYSGDSTWLPSSGTAVAKLKLPASGPLVIPSVTPNPVSQVGTAWPFQITFSEKAGAAAILTAFTVDGINSLGAISPLQRNIGANASVTVSLTSTNLKPPVTRVFHFEGTASDSSSKWQRDLSVAFGGPVGSYLTPSISMFATPATVQQNMQADPLCQWSQQLTVQETSGFYENLSSLNGGGLNYNSGRLASLFGTTRLAPFGMLTATVCQTGIPVPSQRGFTLIATPEDGGLVTASTMSSFAAAAASPATFSVSSPSITITSASPTATLDMKISANNVPWIATVLPAAQKWLALSSASGSGPATLTLQASAAGLSNGVYNALLSIQTMNALPQVIQVPVAFIVGASATTSILGVGNAASGGQQFAPGQLIAVYGNNLAPVVVSAAIQPLPRVLSGVSATVNGVSAPLWFVSPGQINLQIPYEISTGTAVLGINNNGQVASFNFPVSVSAPGIFAYQGSIVPFASGKAAQTLVGFITGDGDLTPTLASGATPLPGTPLSQLPQSRQPVSMTIGGENASIVFNGLVNGLIGVTQINFTIPPDLPPGPQPVKVTVGGVTSAPVNLTITSGTN